MTRNEANLVECRRERRLGAAGVHTFAGHLDVYARDDSPGSI